VLPPPPARREGVPRQGRGRVFVSGQSWGWDPFLGLGPVWCAEGGVCLAGGLVG